MTLEDKLEKELEELGDTIGSGDSFVNKVMSQIDSPTMPEQHKPISIVRKIAMNRFTKLAAAAALITVAVVLWSRFSGSVLPRAYALRDTIEACNSIRFLHIKKFSQNQTAELWLRYDEDGDITGIRFASPYVGDSVGPLVVAGSYDESEAWLERFNLHITGYGNPGSVLGFDVSTVDPKFLLQRLCEQQKQNRIMLDINEPVQKITPIAVTVTYPEDNRSHAYKKIIYIDQATKLVTHMEKYKLKNGQYKHEETLEFFDYNQQIDPAMFTLDGEIPADANTFEMPDVEAGLPQGDMTDEEIAVELTRRFFEAVIAKDYDRAGLLFLAAPGFMVEQTFAGANLLGITAMGEAKRDPDPDSDAMICSCNVLAEFGGQYYELDNKRIKVQRIGKKPYRWLLTGNTTTVNPVPGKVTISKENVNLDQVTYKGLEPGEFMKKWLVLGWLPYYSREDISVFSKEGQQYSFDTDKLDFLNFTPSVNIDGKDYDWALLESEYNIVDLTQINSEKNDFQIAYVWAQIDMPEQTRGTLGVGSDDGVKVWLNGRLLHENWLYRGVVTDNDRVPVTFKKGKNQLVLKIQNALGPWGFCCRLLEE